MPEESPKTSVKVVTSRFGEIEIPEENVIHMPHGMIGFPQFHRYALIRHQKDSPFFWLQALDNPDLAFVTVNPVNFDPAYQLTLGSAEAKLLKADDPTQVQVWVVVTIPHGSPEKMTANLKAPVVINLINRLAAQVIQEEPRYSVRHSLAPTKGDKNSKK